MVRYEIEADGEPTELYWEHLMDGELITLRRVVLNKMERLEPAWVATFNSSSLKKDLDIAVQNCYNELIARGIRNWMDDVVAGKSNTRSLQDRIDES